MSCAKCSGSCSCSIRVQEIIYNTDTPLIFTYDVNHNRPGDHGGGKGGGSGKGGKKGSKKKSTATKKKAGGGGSGGGGGGGGGSMGKEQATLETKFPSSGKNQRHSVTKDTNAPNTIIVKSRVGLPKQYGGQSSSSIHFVEKIGKNLYNVSTDYSHRPTEVTGMAKVVSHIKSGIRADKKSITG